MKSLLTKNINTIKLNLINRTHNFYQINTSVKNFSQFQDTKQLKKFRKRKSINCLIKY